MVTKSVGENIDLLSTSRLHPIIHVLISNKYATYKEIRDEYTIDEVLDLYESCLVYMYNKAQMSGGTK